MGGFSIDECQSCGGVWLDPGELSLYQDVLSRTKGEMKAEAEQRFLVRAVIPVSVCPRCADKTLQAGSIANLDLSRCQDCHGVFLSGSWWKGLRGVSKSPREILEDPGLIIEVLLWVVAAIMSK